MNNMSESTLNIVNLNAGYGGIPVVRGLNIHVNPGEVVALLGPNGAGKSSLLRSVAGLAKHSGEMVNEFSSFKVQVPIKPVTIGDIAHSDDSEFL